VKPTWVDYGMLLAGLAFLVVHLVGCCRARAHPSLPIAVASIMTGGGVFFGVLLILTPFVEVLQSLPARPEYTVIAGVAVLWVSIQYGWGLWGNERGSR
jgi:uncharacterized membrane protein